MASAATTILQYIASLCWTCLCLTPNALKNPALALVLPTQQILDKLLTDSLLVFAPGLLDVLQSPTPPTIAYFKTLPLHTVSIWAVYLLVLEKAHCRPKIYIGSGTDSQKGVASRLRQYPHGKNLPQHITLALNDGYRLSHKGLLCWSPIPALPKCYAHRTLFLVLETVFTIVFWALLSRTKDYCFPQLCPWPRDVLEYDGCCTHAASYEKIEGQQYVDLTDAQIDALDSAKKRENTREQPQD